MRQLLRKFQTLIRIYFKRIKNLTDYYKKYLLLKEFTLDEGEYGIKNTVETILAKNTFAVSFQGGNFKRLNRTDDSLEFFCK